MNQKKTFLVHGRFQPFHNGHLWLVTEALTRAEHVIIGICTPEICTPEVAEKTGYPCTAEQNPFTHEERARMISNSLSEAKVESGQYTCIPFPSDYKSIPAEVPADTVFLLCVANEADTRKADYIRALGYIVETIRIPDIRTESGSHIRSLITSNDPAWHNLVPPATYSVITSRFEAKQ